jgi:AcrR family transcriptional regulator
MNDLTCPVPRNDNTERIFREAWDLFQARGYRGASMDELCRRCGITKPTLYYYFKDKETLYLHVVLRQLQGFRAIMQEQASLSDRLIRLATLALSGFDASISAMMREMTHIKEPSYHQAIGQAFQEELLGPLVAAIGDAMEAGSLRHGDPDFLAWAYLGLINTFIGRKQGSDATPESLARGLVALFLEGAQQPVQQTTFPHGQSQPREATHLL